MTFKSAGYKLPLDLETLLTDAVDNALSHEDPQRFLDWLQHSVQDYVIDERVKASLDAGYQPVFWRRKDQCLRLFNRKGRWTCFVLPRRKAPPCALHHLPGTLNTAGVGGIDPCARVAIQFSEELVDECATGGGAQISSICRKRIHFIEKQNGGGASPRKLDKEDHEHGKPQVAEHRVECEADPHKGGGFVSLLLVERHDDFFAVLENVSVLNERYSQALSDIPAGQCYPGS